MRDALSLLDQCLGRDGHVTVDVVNQTVGIAARDHLAYFAQAIIDRNTAGALDTLDALHRSSKDMARLCEEMSDYFRALMLIKTMPDASSLVIASEKEMQTMTAQALSMTLSAIVHGLDVFETTLNRMRYASPRTQLEMAFVKLCMPELDTTPEAMLSRLEALERGALSRPVSGETALPVPQDKRPEISEPKAAVTDEQEAGEPVSDTVTASDPVLEPEPEPALTEHEETPEVDQTDEPAPETEEPTPEEMGQMSFDMSSSFASAPTEPREEKATAPQLEEPSKKRAEEAPVKQKSAARSEDDVERLSEGAERYRDWSEVLKVIKDTTKSVAMAFSGSTAYINGDYMLIDASELAFDILRKSPDQRMRMREAIKSMTGKSYKLGPYRKPKEDDRVDPIEELEKRASDMGIDIKEETSEYDTDESSEK